MANRLTAEQVLKAAQMERSFWGRRIISAEKRGGFTDTDERYASQWTTCACGKVDSRIPMLGTGGGPCDSELRELGYLFTDLIIGWQTDFVDAADTLVRIENRADVLLLKMAKRKRVKSRPVKRARRRANS